MEEEKWTQDEQIKYKYICESCDFHTIRKSAWEVHLKTKKHERNISGVQKKDTNNTKKSKKKKHEGNISSFGKKDTNNTKQSKTYTCGCGKSYYDHSGLYKHKKKCDGIFIQPIEKDIKDEKIDKLTEQVGILTTALTTAITEGKLGNTTNTTNSNNTTNNQFNLNIFLNEKCKDAMNITDFVDQIKLQLSDLETQGKVGYVDGISNIFIKNLDEMDEDKRPIHCTDVKREVLYVKNNDTWEKGETGREQMKKAIDTISKNNIKQFGQWINENPQCKVAHTPKADQFHQISSEVAGSAQEKNVDKVIRKIAKGTIIDKNNS